MYKTNRAVDSCAEKFITKWLSENYFSKIFSTYELVEDKERQLLGIDVIGDGANYDIKAQSSARYLNNPTNTFSVEISFLNKNLQEVTGWFINSKLSTQYYMFIWIPKCEHNNGIISDIEEVEILIVDKNALVNGVAKEFKLNLPGKTAKELANEMREHGEYSYWCGYNLKFVYSELLAEKPVNIVLKKSFLSKFAIRHDIVRKGQLNPI